VAVEGIADVGQRHRPQAEGRDPVLEALDAAGEGHRGGEHRRRRPLAAEEGRRSAFRLRGLERIDRDGLGTSEDFGHGSTLEKVRPLFRKRHARTAIL
jgi:hypothetical protein